MGRADDQTRKPERPEWHDLLRGARFLRAQERELEARLRERETRAKNLVDVLAALGAAALENVRSKLLCEVASGQERAS